MNTDSDKLSRLENRVKELEKEDSELNAGAFHLENMKHDHSKVAFYTGFPSYAHLEVCFDFLGPAAMNLQYKDTSTLIEKGRKLGRPRSLPPLEEFFLTMVRLRLGLLEQDIAYRFGISQSTVSRIFATWINFIYHQFKGIPLWPPREYIRTHMPQVFKNRYPTTRVVIDATEVFI